MNLKVLHGPQDKSNIPKSSLGKIFIHYLKSQDPEKICLVDAHSGKKITSRELYEKSVKVAISLRKLGMKLGDVVGIAKENSLEYVIFVLACLYEGLVICTASPQWTQRELSYCFGNSKPKLVLCSPKVLEKVFYLKAEFKYIEHIITSENSTYGLKTFSDMLEKTNQKDFDSFEPEEVDTGNVAFIFSSSGTSGLPKGVMLTHKNLRASVVYYKDPDYVGFTKEDVTVVMMPLYHIYGLHVITASIWCSVQCIIMNKFVPDLFLQSIQDYKINKIALVPTVLVFLAKSPMVSNYDISSLKEIACGSAPLQSNIHVLSKRRLKLTHLRQAFGCTEVTGACLYEIKSKPKAGTVGVLIHDVMAKVRDVQTHEILGPHQYGELCFKGATVMKGYIHNETATKEAFDEEGFFLTGDAGYYDEDGCFFVIDRIKDLIKYKSLQVSPSELEGILLSHPAIKEAGVVGTPDERAGELPTAFVVKDPESNITEKEIVEFVAAQVYPGKRLHGGVRFIEIMPKTSNGKMIRRALKDMVTSTK